MKIKKASIKNFRLFSADTAFEVGDFNIPDGENEGSGLTAFVGENGCGKSSLLEALVLPLLSYKADSFSINDFNDTSQKTSIELFADNDFNVDGTMPKGTFQSKGFLFEAGLRARENKAYLSSVVVSDQRYIKADGQEKPKDGSPDLRVNVNNPFKGKRFDENDILFLDKNRTFQTRGGTYNPTRFDRLMEDFDHQYIQKQESVQNLNRIFDRKIKTCIEHEFLEATIKKFKEMSNSDVRLNLIDNWRPFSKGFFAEVKANNQQVSLGRLGSGYEMMFSLIYSFFLSRQSGKQLIAFIDEPELHLHPSLQSDFVEFLLGISKESQVILTSHSPLLIKQLTYNENVGIQILQKSNGKLELVEMDKRSLPYVSANEINFLAFGLATAEFHNELYGHLQENTENYNEKDFEEWLSEEKGICKDRTWQREKNGEINGDSYAVTLQTFIRNKIHHPENKTMQNYTYSSEDLKQSIDEMIKIYD